MEQESSDWMEKTEWKSGMSLSEEMAYFDAHPEQITEKNLNNFRAWVPGGWRARDVDSTWLNTLPTPNPLHTALFNEHTPQQFIAVVLETIHELDVTDSKTSLVPLYLALRAKGYSHYDLVA